MSAQARLQSAQALLAQAQADQQRIEADARRAIALAHQGITSTQQADEAEAQLKAQQALVRSAQDQVRAAQSELQAAQARTNQAQAALNTVASTQAQALSAEAQLEASETRLGYTQVVSPVSGIVTVRAAREGEVVSLGQPVVIVTDLSDTWVRAAIPETQATHIAIGDALRVRLPSGETIPGKVTFKAPEAEFATQRDVTRRKRDIKAIVLKVVVDNSHKTLVPGMTAEVLIPRSKTEGQ